MIWYHKDVRRTTRLWWVARVGILPPHLCEQVWLQRHPRGVSESFTCQRESRPRSHRELPFAIARRGMVEKPRLVSTRPNDQNEGSGGVFSDAAIASVGLRQALLATSGNSLDFRKETALRPGLLEAAGIPDALRARALIRRPLTIPSNPVGPLWTTRQSRGHGARRSRPPRLFDAPSS